MRERNSLWAGIRVTRVAGGDGTAHERLFDCMSNMAIADMDGIVNMRSSSDGSSWAAL